MFSRSKNTTTMKIEVISGLWSVLLIAMLAGTVTLYDSNGTQHSQQEVTLSTQPSQTTGLR